MCRSAPPSLPPPFTPSFVHGVVSQRNTGHKRDQKNLRILEFYILNIMKTQILALIFKKNNSYLRTSNTANFDHYNLVSLIKRMSDLLLLAVCFATCFEPLKGLAVKIG